MGDKFDGGATGENIFQRMCGAVCSSICGVIMIPICMGLVFWNENNLVINEATANLVQDAKVYSSCLPSPDANGDLVLVACDLYAPDIAGDLPSTLSPFLPHFSGASLSWSMEIYQWTEDEHEECHKTNSGGKSCRKTYSYDTEWTTSPVNSNDFRHPWGHDNGNTDFPHNLESSGSVDAPPLSVVMSQHGTPDGGFVLDSNLVSYLPSVGLGDRLKSSAPPSNSSDEWQGAGSLTPQMLHKYQGYLQTAYGSPQIGDLRIQITGQMSDEATACGVQQRIRGASSDYTFVPLPPKKFGWFGKKTKPLERLQAEKVTQDEFIDQYHAENQGLAWVIRIVSLILMTVAFNMVLSPLSVAADGLMVLNYCTCGLGSVLDGAAQCIIGTAAFLLALVLTTITIAVAWFTARPAASLLSVAVVLGVYVVFVKTQKKKGSAGMPYVRMSA